MYSPFSKSFQSTKWQPVLVISMSKLRESKLNENFTPEDLYSFMEQLEEAYCSMLRGKDEKSDEDLELLNNLYNSIVEIRNFIKIKNSR